jgi:hypothetical protein
MPLSAAGTALGLDSSYGAGISGATAETADQKKKRLQAL